MPGSPLQQLMERAKNGMRELLRTLRGEVVDKTPRWRGGLRRQINHRLLASGLVGEVYGADEPVMHVMEANPAARWASKMPPPDALEPWVAERLGLSSASSGPVTRGKNKGQARKSMAWTVAFLIARKTKQRGTIMIPLRFPGSGVPAGMGMMFRRTAWRYRMAPGPYAQAFKRGYLRGAHPSAFGVG